MCTCLPGRSATPDHTLECGGNALVIEPRTDAATHFFVTTHSRLHHHGSGPSSFENVPVGPFASRSARRTGSRAACWTVRVPWKLLRSVAVNPGHAALTLMPVDSSAEAKASVTALSAVFD